MTTIYWIGFIFHPIFWLWGIKYFDGFLGGRWWSNKTAARQILLTPIWPISMGFIISKLLIIACIKISIWVWKEAELPFPKLKETKPGQLSLIDKKNEEK